MDLAFAGRRVLITGASRGIGEAIAQAFAREAAKIMLVARDRFTLGRAAERMRRAGAVVVVKSLDVSRAGVRLCRKHVDDPDTTLLLEYRSLRRPSLSGIKPVEKPSMHTGSCFCRAVKYEIDGDISRTYYCHCSRCRKLGGSAFSANAVISPAQFRVLNGAELLKSFVSDGDVERIFCSVCGSHLLVRQGDQMRLRLGSLDSSLGKPLDMHIFAASKADWFQILDDLPQHDKRPQV